MVIKSLSFLSPLGSIFIESDSEIIKKVTFTDELAEDDEREPYAISIHCKNQLQEYFQGKRKFFDLPLKPEGTEFQKKVWKTLQEIPFGKTITYGELANKLGDKNLMRAVGGANGRNPIAVIIPCHRVVGLNGTLTGYSGGLWRKKFLLDLEQPEKQALLF